MRLERTMPPAKPKGTAKPAAKPVAKAKPAAKAAAKPASASKAAAATGSLPLKSRTISVIDIDSPQFKAARRRDIEALKSGDADGMQHAEGLFIDKDVQKWWT
jgi:hypothetical protein